MKAQITLMISLLLPFMTWGQDLKSLFEQANEAYKRSEYNHAIDLYQEILATGKVSPKVYFNLGNAYFKDNQLGKSILNYERALQLDPADTDIQYNLRLAKSKTIDKEDERLLLFYEVWWKSLYMTQSSDGWAITAVIFILLFFIFTGIYLFIRIRSVRKFSFYIALFFLLSFVFSIVFAQKQYNILTDNTQAIVMNPRVTVKSSPSEQSPDLFLIHEGTKLTIRNAINEWYEIQLPDGNIGWIKQESIEKISVVSD
ncbi:MAG: tetratricopeptide repeat protein [Bacteroidota bacterium]